MKLTLMMKSGEKIQVDIKVSSVSPSIAIMSELSKKNKEQDDLEFIQYENLRIDDLSHVDDWYSKLEALSKHNMRKYKTVMTDEVVDIQPTDPHKALDTFKRLYPRNRVWQLAVDGQYYTRVTGNSNEQSRRDKGWLQYERTEPGSLKAFFRGLNQALKNIDDKEISHELIKALHECVTKDVFGINAGINIGDYRDSEATFAIDVKQGRITQEGLTDLLNKIENNELGSGLDDNRQVLFDKSSGLPAGIFGVALVVGIGSGSLWSVLPTAFDSTTIGIKEKKEELMREGEIKDTSNEALAEYIITQWGGYRYQGTSALEIERIMNEVIAHYNDKIKYLTDPDEILELIGTTTECFERIHPFGDANGRTFVNLLQNRLLIQNGFPPATLFQPNVYDVFGNHVAVLKRGMQNTFDIYQGKDIFGYYMHRENTLKEQDFFLNMDELSEFVVQEFSNPLFALLEASAASPVQDAQVIQEALGFTDDLLLKLDCIDEAIAKINPTDFKAISLFDSVFTQLISDIPLPQYNQTSDDFALQELHMQIEQRVSVHQNTMKKVEQERDKEKEERISESVLLNECIEDLQHCIDDIKKSVKEKYNIQFFEDPTLLGSKKAIETAEKLLSILNGEKNVSLDTDEMKALNNPLLNKVVAKYKTLLDEYISYSFQKVQSSRG
ncbi:Fic family protein [Legionella fallonii]|uniref:Fido domain-containing protein n=1 Tax=Legionella fallonii LLAP-10 TaxID=1212491 RepID=A0A098G706_9GAMM|nr:Fic family protein [Legionella fallonii]CEG57280.1 protein of unknown function [Fic domain] [Legionella fallonii LLAP-10]